MGGTTRNAMEENSAKVAEFRDGQVANALAFFADLASATLHGALPEATVWRLLEHGHVLANEVRRAHRTRAVRDVLEERERQARKGYDADHDDDHDQGEIASAAAFMLDPASEVDPNDAGDEDLGWAVRLRAKHHADRRRQVVIGVALGLAEIERLDREEERKNRRREMEERDLT